MLRERVRFFAKDILYYGVGNMLYSLVQFISMPLVVKNLDKSQVADWNILLPTGVLLSALVIFGMDSATVRYLKDAETEKQKSLIFSTGFFFELFLSITLAISLLLLSGPATSALRLSSGQVPSWVVLMCWLPGIIMAQYFQNWFKYSFQRGLFVRLIALQAGIYLGGIILLSVTGRVSLMNVMLVMLASQWLTAFAGLIYCRRLFIFRIDIKLLTDLIKYGFPFMLLAFGLNFIMNMDRYILVGNTDKDEFAVYTQAVRITAIVTMVVSSFNFAFGPFSLALLGKPDAERTLSRFHSYYLMLMTFLGLSFLAFGKVIINIFAGPGYFEGYNFFVFFVIGYILYGLYSFAQLGIIYSRKSYLNIYVVLAGLATCALTGLLLVKRFEGYGTAIAFMLANIVMVILANFYSARHMHIRYHLVKDLFLVFTLALAGYGLTQLHISDHLVLDGIIKFLMVLVIMPVLFFFLLTGEEKNYIKRLLFKTSRTL